MRIELRNRRGFTLVELLTVIAIIGILAGLAAAGLSRAFQRAQETELESRMRNVETLLFEYYTNYGTFPPAYGYVNSELRDTRIDCGLDGDPLNDETPRENPGCLNETDVAPPNPDTDLPKVHYFLGSYMALLEQSGNRKLYDPFAQSYDTDRDGTISYFEYLPYLDRAVEDDDVLYEDGTLGPRNNLTEVADLLRNEGSDGRPFVYVPVNRRQAERIGQEYVDLYPDDPRPNEKGLYAGAHPLAAVPVVPNSVLMEDLANMSGLNDFSEIPPVKYDAFVLISVGPNETTAGMLSDLTSIIDLSNYPEQYRYHILGNVLYYMASRDANNNGLIDFHYKSRTVEDETPYRLTDTKLETDPGYLGNAPGPYIRVSSR